MAPENVETKIYSKFESHHWQAMIDSVVEFISASRTMLQVLNERIKATEDAKILDIKKKGDENTNNEPPDGCLEINSDDPLVDQLHFNESYDLEQKSKSKNELCNQENVQLQSKSFWDVAAEDIASKQHKSRCRNAAPQTTTSRPKMLTKDTNFMEGSNNGKELKKRDYISIYQMKKSVSKDVGKTENC